MRHTILFHCWPVLRDRTIPCGHLLYIIVFSAMLPNSQNFSQCVARVPGLQEEPSEEVKRAGCNLPGGKIRNVICVACKGSLDVRDFDRYYPLILFRSFVTDSDESG
jgi:hypothetical protein